MRITSTIGLAAAISSVAVAAAWIGSRDGAYVLDLDGPQLRWSDPGQKSGTWIKPVRNIVTADRGEYWFRLPVPDDLATRLNPWRDYEVDLGLSVTSEQGGSSSTERDWSAYSFFEIRDGNLTSTLPPQESWMRHGELLRWHFRGEQTSPTEYTQTYSFRFFGTDDNGPELASRRVTIHLQSNAEQGSADQPATAPESKPEGEEKAKPESEGRSQ